MIAIDGPRPNGARPVPAYATVAAQEWMSEAVGRVVAVQDLGREVAGRAEQPAGAGQLRVVGDPGQAEVDQDRVAALHQHVRRLHVAVQHARPRAPSRAPRPGRGRTSCRSAPVIGPSSWTSVVQREAGHVAGGDVGDVGPRVGVHDLGDPPAADPGQRADLAGQPPPDLVVADDVRSQHLERDPGAVAAARRGGPRPCRPRRGGSAGCTRRPSARPVAAGGTSSRDESTCASPGLPDRTARTRRRRCNLGMPYLVLRRCALARWSRMTTTAPGIAAPPADDRLRRGSLRGTALLVALLVLAGRRSAWPSAAGTSRSPPSSTCCFTPTAPTPPRSSTSCGSRAPCWRSRSASRSASPAR